MVNAQKAAAPPPHSQASEVVEALHKLAIVPGTAADNLRCKLCNSEWDYRDEEKHIAGCALSRQAPQPQASEVVEQILAALDQALNSLEYIDRAHPEITGTLQRVTALGMVREAIPKAKALSRQAPQPAAAMPSGEKTLSGYSDAEIASEHHRRAMTFLGDQTVGVSFPAAPSAQGKA